MHAQQRWLEFMMFHAYVINLNRHPSELHQFYQHADAKYFQLLPAIDKRVLDWIGDNSWFFNNQQFKQMIGQDATLDDIIRTLSHINVWKTIIQNNKILDNEFVVIAEDNIILTQNFSKYINAILKAIGQFSKIDILVLQKCPATQTPEEFGRGKFKILKHTQTLFRQVDASLYLIKKSRAKAIVQWLETYKPCWLAQDFNVFCPEENLGVLLPALGYAIPKSNLIPDMTQDPNRPTTQKYQRFNSHTVLKFA